MSRNNNDLGAPWQFKEDNHGVSDAPAYGLLDRDGLPLGVDIRTVDINSRPITNAVAKGRLVAAAPKMLDVLQKSLQEFVNGCTTAETMMEVREVIAEAKGESDGS